MMNVEMFGGFPAQGLAFLEQLKVNNDREWFNARKETYLASLQQPAVDFVFALGERLKDLSPGISYDLRTNGSGSVLRIYRDTRFGKDKRPYNTALRMFFWEGTHKKMENPGFFVRVDASGAGVFVGMWRFPKPLLEAYREAVADTDSGAALETALAAIREARSYSIGGEHYKRVPRPFDAWHPRADLLRHNGLYAHFGAISPDVVLRQELVDVCIEHFRNMAPLHYWLVEVAQHLPG